MTQGCQLSIDMGTTMSPRAMIVGVVLILNALACGGADRILPPTITLVRSPTDTPGPTDTPLPIHTERPRPDPVPTIHVVQPGETLSQIAKQYGGPVDALTAGNGIADPHQLQFPGSGSPSSPTGGAYRTAWLTLIDTIPSSPIVPRSATQHLQGWYILAEYDWCIQLRVFAARPRLQVRMDAGCVQGRHRDSYEPTFDLGLAMPQIMS